MGVKALSLFLGYASGLNPPVFSNSHILQQARCIPHIRNLTFGACDANVLSPVIQIPWTHLEVISLGLRVSTAVDLESIPNLVCLTSLLEVVFRGGQWKTEDIARILSRSCSCRRPAGLPM